LAKEYLYEWQEELVYTMRLGSGVRTVMDFQSSALSKNGGGEMGGGGGLGGSGPSVLQDSTKHGQQVD